MNSQIKNLLSDICDLNGYDTSGVIALCKTYDECMLRLEHEIMLLTNNEKFCELIPQHRYSMQESISCSISIYSLMKLNGLTYTSSETLIVNSHEALIGLLEVIKNDQITDRFNYNLFKQVLIIWMYYGVEVQYIHIMSETTDGIQVLPTDLKRRLKAYYETHEKIADYKDIPKDFEITYTLQQVLEDDDLKYKVLEKSWDINLHDEWYEHEYLATPSHKKLARHHCTDLIIKYDKVYFCVDGSSYISFQGIEVDKELLMKYLGIPKRLRDRLYLSFTESRRNTNSPDIKIIGDGFDLTNKQQQQVDEAIYKWGLHLESCLKDLRMDYEYRIGEEGIIEALEANDYIFDSEGNIVG